MGNRTVNLNKFLVQVMAQNYIVTRADCEYYAVGDVHGCMTEYFALIDKIYSDAHSRGKKPIVIQLGDMIDRGPAFIDLVLADVADYRCMGNHELNFIAEWYGYKACSSVARRENHDRLLAADVDTQNAVLKALVSRRPLLVMHTTGRRYVFSHAPIRDVENSLDLTRCDANTNMSDYCMRSTKVDIEAARYKAHTVNTTFVYGHQSWEYRDIEDQIAEQSGANTVFLNVDSGCVYGDELIALRVLDGGVLRVASNVKVPRH